MSKQITNVIFFLRHDEPRIPELDLYYTLERQLDTANRYDFPATYLLEYDSLIDERYVSLLKNQANAKSEIGGWFEVVQQLVEKAGLTWRGREGYSWDWYCHCGFSVGYTKDERRLLIDTYMAEFKSAFGYYPKTMGSWLIDAYSLEYMEKQYGVVASCNCRDQWGTDGYTLWGGYYGQGYYPSKNNVLCPASTKENQINIPVFRMLGIDYLHQYDLNLDIQGGTYENKGAQHALTLEPIYNNVGGVGGGGGNHDWVDWYMKENFCDKTLSFGYVHIGQENSFLWSEQEAGTLYQLDKIKKLESEGKMDVMTLSETALWYKSKYELTPPSSVKSETDWRYGFNCKTLWYSCKNYRCNFYESSGKIWIRDIFLFRENYTERYMDNVCTTTYMTYDNLPFVDGNLWSGNGVRAGLYISIIKNGRERNFTAESVKMEYPDDKTAKITAVNTLGDEITVVMTESGIEFSSAGSEIKLAFCTGNKKLPINGIDGNRINLSHNGFDYNVSVENSNIALNGKLTFSPSPSIKLVLDR